MCGAGSAETDLLNPCSQLLMLMSVDSQTLKDPITLILDMRKFIITIFEAC